MKVGRPGIGLTQAFQDRPTVSVLESLVSSHGFAFAVEGSVLVNTVNDQIQVNKDRFCNESLRLSSSSSIASEAAKALSHRKFRSDPSANVFCTKLRFLSLVWVRPARRPALRASLNDSLRSFMAARSREIGRANV